MDPPYRRPALCKNPPNSIIVKPLTDSKPSSVLWRDFPVNTLSRIDVYSLRRVLLCIESALVPKSNAAAVILAWPGVMRDSTSDGSDDALVSAARAGDRAAFGHLYTRHAPMVHGILLCKVPHHAVDDLVQDVFLRALRRLETLHDASRFGGWLAAIARNCAADFFRSSHPGDESFDESAEADSGSSKDASAADKAEAVAILSVIRTLPEAYREPLILRLVEGMTGPEIAARTGLTHGSVRVNLHRGMQQLREILDRGGASGKLAVKP